MTDESLEVLLTQNYVQIGIKHVEESVSTFQNLSL